MLENLEYLPGLANSDHVCLSFGLRCYATSPHVDDKKLNVNKGNYIKFSEELNACHWHDDLLPLNFTQAWDCFSTKLGGILTTCVPPVKKYSGRRNIYINHEARKLIKEKQHLWKKYTATHDYYDYARYASTRNRLRVLTRSLRRDHELNLATNIATNPKAFWKYVNSRLKTKSQVDDLLREDGSRATTDDEKAKTLNEFFSSVFTAEDATTVHEPTKHFEGAYLNDIDITEEKIRSKLRKLDPCKSPGPDGLHPRILGEVADQLASPLSILYRKSLDEGILPESWREGHVIPIHKKGSRNQASNYRPVSLTSIVVKVLESVIRDAIVEHMTTNHQFAEEQHGFVPGRSCMTQLITVIEEWSQSLQSNEPVDVIYLDFRKAFDSVPHRRLVKKLDFYGIHGKIKHWIEEYLRGRKQRVALGGARSAWAPVLSGIPQGSVLGPTLFVIYINDLPDVVESACKLFADDTKLYRQVRNQDDRELLQKDLESLMVWSDKWLMPFNENKCKSLHLGKANIKTQYSMGGIPISQVEQEKDLGVIIDSQLKFHNHTSAAINKATRILAMIKKSFILLDNTTLALLYKSMVRPHLEYGNVIWGPHYSLDQQAVEKVQRWATKLVPAIQHLPYAQRLEALGLPSLHYRRRRGDMITIFKIMSGRNRMDKNKFFPQASGPTRGHKWKIFKSRADTELRQRVLSIRAINDWNSLPANVVEADTPNAFKNRLDKHWENHQFILP